MSTSLQSASPDLGPRRGLPRWAWFLIGLLTVIAVVAAAIAVFAVRGRQVVVLPPEPTAPAASSSASPTASPSSSPAPALTIADGCLGGVTQLDRAVLSAQRDASLTPVGAASFTATLIRWALAAPPPPYQDETAREVFADGATPAARRSLSSSKDLGTSTGAVDFSTGRYYVEAFDGRSAIVSYVASANGTLNGAPLEQAIIGGAVHLQAVNGTWHYVDLTSERSIEDLQRIATPYSGGC